MPRIVVGIDGSENSKRALRWAVAEAQLRAATVVAVTGWHVPYVAYAPYLAVVDPNIFEAEANAILDETVAGVDGSGLVQPIEKVAAMGSAVGVLFDAALGADLLVVGARGLGGFAGLLLGSVSHKVAQHHGCPVVIVPPEE